MRLLPWIGFSLLIATGLAKQTLNVLVISDFSLAFVPSSTDRSALASGPFICPSSAYPNALAQFQFTSDVIADVSSAIPMRIQYYVYSGGDGDPIGNIFSSRDNFTETSIPAYTKFCAQGPEQNDFERFIKLTITPSVNTDMIILFTAASQAQINKGLPILSNNVKKVIVLGLKGTDPSNAYPNSAVSLSDFSEPERVSCMINELYETIYGKVSDVNAVAVCYPTKEPTTVVTTTVAAGETTMPQSTESPRKRILYINDFTSDYIVDDAKLNRARRPSNSLKCPGNAHPEAVSEFEFTNSIVQIVSSDMEIYYYAYNGDNHNIPITSCTKDTFQTDTEFKDVVCFEDYPLQNDFPSLASTIQNFPQDLDVIVLFSAASKSEFNNAYPLTYTDATMIVVGMNGASAFEFFPDTSIIIDNFSDESAAVISCMIGAAFGGEESPVQFCGAQRRPSMSILFINDFTSDFVGDEMTMVKKIPKSKDANVGKCPMGMYPEAGQEFNFTVDIVNLIEVDADLLLMFNEYLGGPTFYLYPGVSSRDDFANVASATLRDACIGDHYPTDFDALSSSLRYVPADVIVLFTSVELDKPLDVPNKTFKRIIITGLNGAEVSKAYPDSSFSIDDFSRPSVISCMIDRLWDDIDDQDLLTCAT